MFGAPNGYFGLGNQSMFQTQPDQQPKQGMFGGGNIGSAISAAIGGYLARTNPGASEAVLAPLQMKQQQMMLAQQADLASQRELQRQKDYYQFQLDNPKQGDGSEYERLLAASGVVPGSPEYLKHISAKVNQMENPMVMTPYGPMPYSQVAQPAVPSQPLSDEDILKMSGGPASQAPVPFPGGY